MTEAEDHKDLQARVEALEREVVELRRLASSQMSPPASSQVSPAQTPTQSPAHAHRAAGATPPAVPKRPQLIPVPKPALPSKAEHLQGLATSGEQWLGRAGIVFVFLSLVFLFRYSIVHGWITPPFRLVTGLLTGGVLLWLGLRLESKRRRFSQILLGGAVAIFYLVGFAGFQLYGLVPYWPSFLFMVAISALAFFLAIRQNHVILALLGASGGLATPFLIASDAGTMGSLVVHTAVILIGAGLVQRLKGWRTLLLNLLVGGLPILLWAIETGTDSERWIVSFGLFAWWAVGCVSPLHRSHKLGPDEPFRIPIEILRLLTVALTFLTCGLLGTIWDLELKQGAFFFFAAAGMLGSAAYRLNSDLRIRALTAEASMLLTAWGINAAFDHDPAFLILLLAVMVAHHLSSRAGLGTLKILSLALLILLGCWNVLASANAPISGTSEGFELLATIRLAGLAMAFVHALILQPSSLRSGILLTVHGLLMLWFAVELKDQTHARALTSMAWGVQGLLPLLLSFRHRQPQLQLVGLATLGIVAGKMILLDMADLDLVWRILMFAGFGAVFLALSYWIKGTRNRSNE